MRTLLRGLVILIACTGAFAQTDRGTITGTVADPSGAVVPGAPLELVNTQTGNLYVGASSTTGNYTFNQLPVGRYQLTVTVPGFKAYIRQNLGVQVAQTIRENVVLEVGTAAESVTVTAEASLLQTESGALSVNVTTARLNSLPILGVGLQTASSHGVRNPLSASMLSAGVFFLPNNTVRVNGAPSNTFGIRVDGQDSTNGVVSFAQAQTQPSVDAIEEIAIQTSNYSAEFGQAGSGLFNFTTKSGTNDWHGSVYDYFVNEALWAHQPYNGIRTRQRRNDYGGTIGGPVIIPKVYNGRDRTFFFFNYEEFRDKTIVSNAIQTVPIDAYRDGNFAGILTGRALTGSAARDGLNNALFEGMIFDPATERFAPNGTRARLQFPGNVIPTVNFDPSAVKIQNLIPKANLGSGLINNYLNPFPSARKTPIPAIKLDHSLNEKMKASFYWSTTETAVQYCLPLCGSTGLPLPIDPTRGTFIESFTMRGNFDYTVTPTMLLHFGVGYINNDFKDTSPVDDFNTQTIGISGGLGTRFPQMLGMTGPQNLGGMRGMGPGAQSQSREMKPTGNVSLSWVKSNHTFKFGGEIRIEGYPQTNFTNSNGTFNFSTEQSTNPFVQGLNLSGAFLGFPYASFLLGSANSVSLTPVASGKAGRQFWSWFAQDTWKVTRKITLDYGLRWDLFTAAVEQYGRAPSFDPNLANPTAGGHPGATIFEATCNCTFARNYKHAYAPRLGLAYQLNTKTVLRAGMGLSYSMSQGAFGQQGTGSGGTQTFNEPNFGDGTILSRGIPLTPTWPDMRPGLFPTIGTTSGAPPVVDPNSGRPARMLQWSIGLQREVARDLVVEASYVANRGAWWRTGTLVDYNALRPEILASAHGLDWYNSETDRTLLTRQLSSSLAGRFRNRFPYSGFPETATVAQSLRSFPQFGNLGANGPAMGKTWYESLQMKVTKRFSRGLDFTYTYTYSKELELGAETDGGGGTINDVFNRNTNKQLSSFSRPHYMVLGANYTIPQWSQNRLVNWLVSDWQLGAVLRYGSGQPFNVPGNITNNNNSTLLRATWSQRVPGEPLFLQDLNCHCFDPSITPVLNPDAWTDTPNGQWSPAPARYNDFRQQRRQSELLSLGRVFRIKERATVMIRAEFNNALNRTQIPTPSTARNANFNRAPDGRYTSGFGTINTTGNVAGERQGTLVLRFQF